ncbi:hypothetical protein KIN20_021883 [Parelaphostrongylus tenuis]|uniref:C2H2-type domain-containing protein n=1 Tax=Parelaphostrongylus tenuis TaxID=148309 RepID=A0AAD5MPV8_PARTN|nr:hypothetical protein KIN20_021883 [Parelaphostrongylus tenuis]
MVVVHVALESPAQVQDLLSFLVSRSYNDFRLTDEEPRVSGSTSTSASTGLSHSSNRPLCRSPLTEDIHSAQNDVTLSQSLREKKPPSAALNASVGPQQLDHFDQKPTKQEDLKTCVVLPNAGPIRYSESKELMTEEATAEIDMSFDVSSMSQNASTNEDERPNSNEEFDSFYSDPFNVIWLRDFVRSLRKRGILKDRIQCAICEVRVVACSGSMCRHINYKHTRFPLYGCSICHYTTLCSGSITHHMSSFHKVANSDEARARSVKLFQSEERHRKMKEMFETAQTLTSNLHRPGAAAGTVPICSMVVVHVKLENPAQVQDLLSFLLSRSYNNFRVTDEEPLAPGDASAKASAVSLSQSSSRPLCRSPSMDDVHSAHNGITLSELLREEKPLTVALNASTGPHQLDRFDQKPSRQDLKACVALPKARSLPSSELTELMTEEDTMENDLSFNVSSMSHNTSTNEDERANSNEEFDNFYGDPFNVSRFRDFVRSLRKRGIMKDRIHCAICEISIVACSGSMCRHINYKHTRFPLYGCSICRYTTLNSASIIQHMSSYHNITNNVRARTRVIKLFPTREQHKKMEEMLEVCFGVRPS